MDTVMVFLLLFLIVCAIAASVAKSSLSAIVIFSAYSLVMCVIWIIMESPDLAITEAAVGAGVTTVLFYATLKKIDQIDLEAGLKARFINTDKAVHARNKKNTTKKLKTNNIEKFIFSKSAEKKLQIAYRVLAICMVTLLFAFMFFTVLGLPDLGIVDAPENNEVASRYIESGLKETGAVNIVSGMILDYRAFDTFGESCVLFVATVCVTLMLRIDKLESGEDSVGPVDDDSHHTALEPNSDGILQMGSKIVVPIVLVFGIYVILNGHLSPGGGFSGGAVLGAGFILFANAFGYEKTGKFMNAKTVKWITFCSLLVYCLAKSYSFFTGANHLESGIPLGTPGAILSSGLILILNICVGFVVACTMYSFYSLVRRGRI